MNITEADLSGAMDVIVVEDAKGMLFSTPFHVVFGKFKVFNSEDKDVEIRVNAKLIDVKMKLTKKGIGYFTYETDQLTIYSRKDEEFMWQHSMDTGKVTDLLKKQKDSQLRLERYQKSTRILDSSRIEMKTFIDEDDEEGDLIGDSKTKLQKQARGKEGPEEVQKSRRSMTPGAVHSIKRNFTPDFGAKVAAPKQNGEAKVLDRITEELNRQTDFKERISKLRSNLPPDVLDPRPKRVTSQDVSNRKSFEGFSSNLSLKRQLSQTSRKSEVDFTLNESDLLSGRGTVLRKSTTLTSTTNEKQDLKKGRLEIQKPIQVHRIRPDQNLLLKFGLVPGKNEVEFSTKGTFFTKLTQKAAIFFYPYSPIRKLIISDVDGTITKSDLIGHFLQTFGVEYCHVGVCQLYTELAKRGYKFIYLTARHLGYARSTSKYLRSIKQGNFSLPEGPLLTSAEGFYNSFKTEVIDKSTDMFKIQVINDVRNVFGHCDSNPIFSGFGNRDNDSRAYKFVNADKHRIFQLTSDGVMVCMGNKKKFTHLTLLKELDFFYPNIA